MIKKTDTLRCDAEYCMLDGKNYDSGKKEINILFTSAGRRSYLIRYFREAIKKEGLRGKVFAANSSKISPAFLEADSSVVTPIIYDESYIPFLLNYCVEHEISAVFSLLDTDLPVLARHAKEFLKNGIRIIVADLDMVRMMNDKYATYQFLERNGINTVKTFKTLQDVKIKLKDGEIKYPLVIKPRWGTGSISIQIADDDDELDVLSRITKRHIQNSFLKYESSQDLEECIVFQEKIDGIEFGLDVINNLSGDYVNTIVKQKIAMRSGETDCAKTVINYEMLEIGEKLGKLIRHPGVLDVDAFLVGNSIYILEMNARFGGGYPFSHAAGVDVPRAIIRWLSGEKESSIFCKAEEGILSQKDIKMIVYDNK